MTGRDLDELKDKVHIRARAIVRAAQDAPACFEFEGFFPNQDGSERAGDSCRGAKAWRFLERLVNVRYFSVRHRLNFYT